MKLRLPQASVLGCLFFFLCAGIVYGLFSSRLPAIKAQTQADEAQIGLALLSLGVGSVIGFIGASPLLRLIQSRTMLKAISAALLLVLMLIGFSFSIAMLYAACFLFGFCTALFDVCMNTQAILLEIKTRHAYMSVMHAFYSVGCLSGSSIGALFASLDITVYINYALSVIALFFFWHFASSHLHADIQAASHEKKKYNIPPFIIFCGLMALCAFISEGSVAEWGGIFLHTVKGADEGVSALSFGVFSALMAFARLFGDRMREYFGDFPLLFGGTIAASAGMYIVLESPWPTVCLIGYSFMGLGLAPVMPIVLSRAGASGLIPPNDASAIVSLFGYSGLLIVPPTLGFLANNIGLDKALLLPLALCLLLVGGSFAFKAVPKSS